LSLRDSADWSKFIPPPNKKQIPGYAPGNVMKLTKSQGSVVEKILWGDCLLLPSRKYYCKTLNFGVWVNLIILDLVILAFLLPTTLKCYCIQIFAARYFRELVRLAKFVK